MDHARVRALLDDAGDDVALAAAELAEHRVVRDVAQPLVDDLLGGEGRDAAEVARAVLGLADDVALVVVLGHEDGDMAGLAVEVHARGRRLVAVTVPVVGLVGVLQVGGQDRLLDDLHELVERDLLLALHETQDAEVDVHAGLLYSDLAAARWRGGLSPLRYPRFRKPGTPGTVHSMTLAFPSRRPRGAQPAVRVLARVGLAAIGILHILIGIIALAVAFGAGGSADQSGALQALVAVPGGLFVLWAVIVGLIFLSLWQILQAITAHKRRREADRGRQVRHLRGARVHRRSPSPPAATRTRRRPRSRPPGSCSRCPAASGSSPPSDSASSRAASCSCSTASRTGSSATCGCRPNRWATHHHDARARRLRRRRASLWCIVGGLVTFGAITSDPEKAGGLDGSLKALTRGAVRRHPARAHRSRPDRLRRLLVRARRPSRLKEQ